ncbi:MAG: hypothetical protein MST07_05280 [Firmicutes bacterium]|nr:hypothetical protein [Bacillota bacterium]
MGGIGGQYGPYVMYVLSQLLQKRRNEENSQSRERSQNSENLYKDENMQNSEIFSSDETGAAWHREENTEILKQFCREGYAQAKKHGHFIVGSGPNGNYIGIPGRFLIEEQPAGGATGFTLWQPLAGGEELYNNLEDMDEETLQRVFGYWIAAIDSVTLRISEV